MIHWVSDLHFDHARIIELGHRPFENVQHMNEALIDNWNRVVNVYDTVIVVGDFCFGHNAAEHLSRLNGYKTLVIGNHDDRVTPKDGWHRITHMLKVRHMKQRFHVCHYPILEWDKLAKGHFHIHGHTHRRARIDGDGRINVAVEAWDYTPVSMDTIMELLPLAQERMEAYRERIFQAQVDDYVEAQAQKSPQNDPENAARTTESA